VSARAKLLRTSTFRLAALYLIVFALSVSALLGYVYWNTTVLLERQTDETTRAEVQALADQYRLRGLRGIIDTIQRRSTDDSGSVYLLADAKGQRIAGNLTSLPPMPQAEASWIEFPLEVDKGSARERHVARAFHTDLAGGFSLVVGRDVEALRQFGNIIRRTIFYALAIALVLGLGGGLLMSRNFLRRVDAITEASRTIMAGNMSGRMPVQGSSDELDRLALALNEMLDQIESLMAGMKEVSSNVAHDLKTPLTRIKARVEAALRSFTAKERLEGAKGRVQVRVERGGSPLALEIPDLTAEEAVRLAQDVALGQDADSTFVAITRISSTQSWSSTCQRATKATRLRATWCALMRFANRFASLTRSSTKCQTVQ
jgi:HAMP domain-containing protein